MCCALAIKLDIDAADIIGGRTIENQLRKLKRDPAVIIGTPGRLFDHIRRRSLDLSNVKTVILDEADQMLANGFRKISKRLLMKHRRSVRSSFSLQRCLMTQSASQGST